MSKILITGGAGFIGSNYVHFRAKKYPNDEIVVLDKLTYAGNLDNIASLLDDEFLPGKAENGGKAQEQAIQHFDHAAVRFIQGDIADQKFINQLFATEKFDIIVNFAAETHVDRSIIDPHIFVQTNILGTHNLLLASRENKVQRYHQISTDEVYGDLGTGSKDYFTEKTPINPNCPYAASKAAADLLVQSYFETYKMPITISRCSNNYGPYQFPEKLIPFFFRLASQDKPLPVYGDGLNVRDWLYVEDHCSAIDLIVQSKNYGEVYNIGGHNEYTNLEITSHVLKFLGKSADLITFVEDRRAHDRRYAMDPSKIEHELGWQPSVTFDEGIQKTFQWYEKNQKWVNNLVEREHSSLKEFKVVSKAPQPTTR
ncbi:MAG: dTDP-glucose 4,6-dehydratase [Candidatus Gracilibacteria bacterium]